MTLETGAWRRLHPAAMLGSSLRALPGAVAGMIGAFSALRDQGAMAILVALAVLLLVVLLTMLGWWRFRFLVGDGEITIERGVVSRQRRVIPFHRVRDVAIERRLLARLLGTARVRIETGGGAADEGDLEMVSLADAERLREHIRRSNLPVAARDAPVETATEPDGAVVYAMNLQRVLIAGLFNFSLLFIAVVFGALEWLQDLRLFDGYAWLRAEGMEGKGLRDAAGSVGASQVLALATAVVLLGVVSGIARTMAREFGFRLTAGAAGLRRRRGLLTLSEVLIPARRTEAARVERRWLSGLFGWRSLAFQTLGADPKEGGVQVAAPLADVGEVAAILMRAGFPALPPALPERPPPRALVRRCLPETFLLLVAAGAAAIRPELAPIVALPLVVGGLRVLAWRQSRHLIGPEATYISGGLLRRRLWIVPYAKVQTLAVTSGPLQRMLGLATLRIDTAGGSMSGGPTIADLPTDQAGALAEGLLVRFYAARSAVRQVTEQSP